MVNGLAGGYSPFRQPRLFS